jgi:hypothetical protein
VALYAFGSHEFFSTHGGRNLRHPGEDRILSLYTDGVMPGGTIAEPTMARAAPAVRHSWIVHRLRAFGALTCASVRLALLLHGHPDGNVPGIANADE